MDWSEIRAQVRIILQEPGVTFYTDAELLKWANFGLLDFCTRSEILKDYTTFAAVVGQQDYDYPTNFLKAKYVTYDGNRVKLKDIHQIGQINTGWQTADNGTPSYYFFIKEGSISFYQKPDDTKDIFMWFIKKSTALSGDGSVPEIPEEYHHALIDYVIFRAKQKDNQVQTANYYKGEFNEMVLQAKIIGKRREKGDKIFNRYPAIQE